MRRFLFLLAVVVFSLTSCVNRDAGEGTTYYINSQSGDDGNSGLSAGDAFRSLDRIAALNPKPGDSILLAAGTELHGSLLLDGVSGSASAPIVISSYGSGSAKQRPHINAAGYKAAVILRNCSYVEVRGLLISADGSAGMQAQDEISMRCGVLVEISSDSSKNDISLMDLEIRDVFFGDKGLSRPGNEVRTPNGTQKYGWGIRVINRSKKAVLKDLEISSCSIRDVGHTGIKLTAGKGKNNYYGIRDFKISGNMLYSTGGPGIQISGSYKGHVFDNEVDSSGSSDDSRKWGRGSGLWTWSSADILIEKNRFVNASGPGDSAGAHIDFNCRNIVLQYNFSANNAGGFCEILGNNHNCAYRYNISVNDGYRIKGEQGSFQEGKIFWLSGYVGKNNKRTGPFNSYFYNNTIYTGEGIVAKFAVSSSAKGVLIANNIFHIVGESKPVKGDQYRPDKGAKAEIPNVIFENNLYLKEDNWPREVIIGDSSPLLGDPGFPGPGGMDIKDYIPANTRLIVNQGINIPTIPGDSIGLMFQLSPEKDIMGNAIKGLPDLGAIETVILSSD